MSAGQTHECAEYTSTNRFLITSFVRSMAIGGTQQGGCGIEGITVFFLWSRTWDRNFEAGSCLGTEGIDPASSFGGKLACEYSEYASGIISAGRVKGLENNGGIPVIGEALWFLPK